jgi:hypothetical protein
VAKRGDAAYYNRQGGPTSGWGSPGSLNISLFVWLVADGWCWFVLREKYWWLVCSERKVLLAGG